MAKPLAAVHTLDVVKKNATPGAEATSPAR
jgi:hypothetical protein